MAGRMRALWKSKAEKGLWMKKAPIPDPGPDEVLIKIRKTAICGTDLHIYNWDEWASQTIPVPMIVGHEYGGEIAGLGSHVRNLSVGQRVTGEGHIVGHKSRAARAGRFHLDPDTKGIGVNVPGAFAEYLTIPSFNVVALPDYVSDDLAAILDPLGNAVHTALSFDLVAEDVLITGAGPIGIMAAAVARYAGARNVVISDLNDYRLDLAQTVADVRPFNPTKEEMADVMAELRMSEGFDVGMEMSGSPEAFDAMVDSMVMGGRVALLGLPPGKVSLDIAKIILKALTIKAIYGREMFETWYKMLTMLGSGLDVEAIITHRFPVAAFNDGFKVMNSRKSGKVILDWSAA